MFQDLYNCRAEGTVHWFCCARNRAKCRTKDSKGMARDQTSSIFPGTHKRIFVVKYYMWYSRATTGTIILYLPQIGNITQFLISDDRLSLLNFYFLFLKDSQKMFSVFTVWIILVFYDIYYTYINLCNNCKNLEKIFQ